MELYYDKISSQLEFHNTSFKFVKFVITILEDSYTKYSFLIIFGPISPNIWLVILDKKEKLNEAYLGSKLVLGLELQGFLMWLRFIEELEPFLS